MVYDIDKIQEAATELGLNLIECNEISGVYDEEENLIMSYDEMLDYLQIL